MQKKIIAVLLSVVMLFSICTMAGCRRGQKVDNTVSITGDIDLGDDIIEISFTHTMGAKLQDVLNTHIEEFNKIYPNIKITHQSAGGWSDINGQINTEIAGGNPPNIAYCYPDHVAMYNIAKSVVVLDELINTEYKIKGTDERIGLTADQKADFIESYYNEGLVYGDNKIAYRVVSGRIDLFGDEVSTYGIEAEDYTNGEKEGIPDFSRNIEYSEYNVELIASLENEW